MRRRWIVAAGLTLALALVVMTATAPLDQWLGPKQPARTNGPTREAATLRPGPPAADLNFTLKDMNGKEVRLASFKGQVVVLNFWATWCGPCKIEIPAFVELYSKYRDEGLVVLGVSVDDPVEELREFAAEYKMNYPVLVGLGHDDIQEAYGPLWGIPMTVFISRDGKISRKHTGLVTKEQAEREIKALLAAPSRPIE